MVAGSVRDGDPMKIKSEKRSEMVPGKPNSYLSLVLAATTLGLSIGVDAEEVLGKGSLVTKNNGTESQPNVQKLPEKEGTLVVPTAKQFKSKEPEPGREEAESMLNMQQKLKSPER